MAVVPVFPVCPAGGGWRPTEFAGRFLSSSRTGRARDFWLSLDNSLRGRGSQSLWVILKLSFAHAFQEVAVEFVPVLPVRSAGGGWWSWRAGVVLKSSLLTNCWNHLYLAF